MIKAAELLSDLGQYHQAISLYEGVVESSRNNSLTKYSIPKWLFCAGLCRLAVAANINTDLAGWNAVSVALSAYESDKSATRQLTFLQDLIQAIRSGDRDDFTQLINEYDALSPLDRLQTNLLYKIKVGLFNN